MTRRTDADFAALFPRQERAAALALRGMFARYARCDVSALHPDDPISTWLMEMDSLDLVEWMMAVEEELGVALPDTAGEPGATFRDWVRVIARQDRPDDGPGDSGFPPSPPFSPA